MSLSVNESSRSDSVIRRRVVRVAPTPAPEPGFIGEGHTAVEVLRDVELSASDPFVLLMDDRLDIAVRRQIGEPHPHAGLETVTLVLEGEVSDGSEGTLAAGDVVWMTAGRGIIHSEHVEAEGKVRILQLWIGLPSAHRLAPPAVQVLKRDEQPVLHEPNASVRLYSGELGKLRSATKNLVPVTLAELELDAGARLELELPASHTGFIYVVSGELTAGSDASAARMGEVAWLDRGAATGRCALTLSAGREGARAVLYAGDQHGESLVQRGPFVADSEATISKFFREYRAGGFQKLSGI
jgi:redox-sensitive bicupin YhaK (pirin superfamily)